MPVDFNDLFKNLTAAVSAAAADSVKEFADSAKKDSLNFLETSKDKLKTWTQLLEAGDLTIDEFKLLVNSQKDLLKMELLKQKGISKIKLTKTKNNIMQAVITTATASIPKLIN